MGKAKDDSMRERLGIIKVWCNESLDQDDGNENRKVESVWVGNGGGGFGERERKPRRLKPQGGSKKRRKKISFWSCLGLRCSDYHR